MNSSRYFDSTCRMFDPNRDCSPEAVNRKCPRDAPCTMVWFLDFIGKNGSESAVCGVTGPCLVSEPQRTGGHWGRMWSRRSVGEVDRQSVGCGSVVCGGNGPAEVVNPRCRLTNREYKLISLTEISHVTHM